MKFIVDSADFGVIRDCYGHLVCNGVTTNPTILAKAGIASYEHLKNIRAFIGKDADLHVQVISEGPEVMRMEARTITDMLGRNTYIKVPVTKAGLKVIKTLKAEGYSVTATAIYTAAQAYLAAQAGADYVAPYVNRIFDTGADGVEVTKQIQALLRAGGYRTQVLAASFKNVSQVMALATAGIDAVTVQPDVIEKMLGNSTVDAAVAVFRHDFEQLVGRGKTMADLPTASAKPEN